MPLRHYYTGFPWEASISISAISLSGNLSKRSLFARIIFLHAEILTGEMAALAVAVCSMNKCMCADAMVCFQCAPVVLASSTSGCMCHLHFAHSVLMGNTE